MLIWYVLWTGFDALFDYPMRLRRRRSFYEKFIKAEFKFFDQEAVAQSIQKLQEQAAEAPKAAEPSKAAARPAATEARQKQPEAKK